MRNIELKDYISKWPTGSSYTCDPPVLDTDIDTVIFVKDLNAAAKELAALGWRCSSREYEFVDSNWMSYVKTIGEHIENYIITDDLEHYQNWVKATELCKSLNLLKKEDRIKVFDVIVDKAPAF